MVSLFKCFVYRFYGCGNIFFFITIQELFSDLYLNTKIVSGSKGKRKRDLFNSSVLLTPLFLLQTIKRSFPSVLQFLLILYVTL